MIREKRPRVPNDSDEGRRANRRVELVITDGARPANAGAGAGATSGPSNAAATKESVAGLIESYFKDLNAGTFDANRYFEPGVERYVTMTNTTTSAMNHYIQNVFPKQFTQHHFEMEAGSLVQESPSSFVYVERARYVLVSKGKRVDKRVKVRVKTSPRGKLTFLHQFQKLEL